MKKTFLIFSALVFIFLNLALTSTHATKITDEQAGLISMTCGSIKIQLNKLQKADSKMRVQLGAGLESILSGYITNLNLRLIKNQLPNSELSDLQGTFTSERERFKSDFTIYSKSLEELIAIDCQAEPYKFYEKLEQTRIKRADLRSSFLRLQEIINWHRESVTKLKESL